VKEHAFFTTKNVSFVKLISKALPESSITYIPDKSDNVSGDKSIPMLDIDEECLAVSNMDYDEYFQDLSNLSLTT
jgi:hypothetical protein